MKKILVLPFLAAGFYLGAQTVGNSPYAAFGLGDTKYDNSVSNNAMGGISSAYVSDFSNDFNFKNPAANQNLQITSIRIEASNENNFYKSDYTGAAQNSTKHSTYFSNVSIAFPLSRTVKFGLGFQPYSSKNYSTELDQTLADGTIERNTFTGEGSVNLVQAAVSYAPAKELSFGVRTNFYFGKATDFQEFSATNAELYNGYKITNKIKSFNFTLGATYQKKLEDDHKLTVGGTATFGNTGNITSTYTNSTYLYLDPQTHGQESVIDSYTKNVKNIIPNQYSLGVGYGSDLKWFASAQFDYSKGENFEFFGQNMTNNPSYRVSAGGWFLPNINNFRNYFSRIIYRYGAYYEKGNLNISGSDINKYALTFGVTLPFDSNSPSRYSSINLGVDLGRRGTTQNNLILQNFVNLRFGINFADKWFNKRLYD